MSGVIAGLTIGAVGLGIAGAQLIGGGGGEEAQQQATNAQLQAERERLAFEKDVRTENITAINDAVAAGLISLEEGNRLASEILQPLAGLQPLEEAQRLLEQGPGELSPQQQREFGRGVQALQTGFSRTSGGGISSRALENAQVFGQDFEARRLDEQLNRLIPFINLAVGARTGLANIASTGGLQEAQLQLGGAKALLGVPSEGIAETFSNIGQIQGSGIIQKQNVQTELLNNLFGIGSNVVEQGIQLFGGGTRTPRVNVAPGPPSKGSGPDLRLRA